MKRKNSKLWERICKALKRDPNNPKRLTGTEILNLSDFDEEILGYLRSDLSTLGNLLSDNGDKDYEKFGAALEVVDKYLNEIKAAKEEESRDNKYLDILKSACAREKL